MASTFHRWEKDPFFSAAEEVQESADRMESTFRTWIHAKKDLSGAWNLDELRRDLQTTLGTTKWQLDEFERAVKLTYSSWGSSDDAKDRHHDFIMAIENQMSKVESSLNESTISQGKPPLPWVRLDEGECNELAMFLSGPSQSSTNKHVVRIHDNDKVMQNSLGTDQQVPTKCLRSSNFKGFLVEAKEKLPGHRRTASASADIGSWKIIVNDDVFSCNSSTIRPDPVLRKIPSFSGLLSTMESSMSQLKWSKNGYNKLKLMNQHQEPDTVLLQSQNLNRGINIYYEKNKSCLDGCDDLYDKQLHGWYGAIQRQLQRSQYHIQYSRPVQVVFSIIFLLCLLVATTEWWCEATMPCLPEAIL